MTESMHIYFYRTLGSNIVGNNYANCNTTFLSQLLLIGTVTHKISVL